MALNPVAHRNSVMLSILFGAFMLTAYLMLHALTHLRPLREGTGESIDAGKTGSD
jgi:hypothetical protein